MVWLLLSWLAVGVIVAVSFGALAHRAEAIGDPIGYSGNGMTSEAADFTSEEAAADDERAAA